MDKDGALAPGDSPGFLLWRATCTWQRAQRAALEPLDLTQTQAVVLVVAAWLQTIPGPATQVCIARCSDIDPMTVSAVIRALIAKGMVTVAAMPGDGRARVIAPTPAGMRIARKARGIMEQVDAAWFGPVPGPSATLVEHLRRLTGWDDRNPAP